MAAINTKVARSKRPTGQRVEEEGTVSCGGRDAHCCCSCTGDRLRCDAPCDPAGDQGCLGQATPQRTGTSASMRKSIDPLGLGPWALWQMSGEKRVESRKGRYPATGVSLTRIGFPTRRPEHFLHTQSGLALGSLGGKIGFPEPHVRTVDGNREVLDDPVPSTGPRLFQRLVVRQAIRGKQ